MRIISLFVSGFVLITLNLFLLAQQEGSRAQIHGKSGEKHWTLNKGFDDGVKVGMRGNFWTKQRSGEKEHNLDIAKFRVIKVEKKQCVVLEYERGPGWRDKHFQWASFIEKLAPPKKISAPKKPQKTDVSSTLGIPSGKSIEWYIKRGERYYDDGEYKLAEICFLKTLEKDAEDPGALIWLKKTREKLTTIEKQTSFTERKSKRDGYITRGDHFFKRGKFETAIAYFIKAYKIFEEDNLLAAEKIITIYKKNKELFMTKIKKENINEKEICNKALTLAEKRINEGKLEKSIGLMNIFSQLGFNEINKKILNILVTSDVKFGNEDVIKGNSSRAEYKKFLNLLINFIKEKYLNANDEMGLKVLLRFTFASCYPGYKELKQMFEVNILYTKYKNLGDQKLNEEQPEDAERFYDRAAEIKPENAEIKQRIERCRSMLNAPKKGAEPKVKTKEKPMISGDTDLVLRIDSRLEALSRKDLSDSEKVKIAREVFKLLDTTDNLEALEKIFDKYDDKSTHYKSLKFRFYKTLVNKFKDTDLNKYFKYFESYMKYGRVNPKEIEENILKKIRMENGILTFDEARRHIGEKISKYYKNEKDMWEIELKNGMKFIYIPAGIYGLQFKYVFIDSFLIGKYEVTNRYYETFCHQNGIKFQVKEKKYNYPVINIDWNYARMYCQWLSKQTGLNIDLPTEAQWEKAALSGSRYIYFWGWKINRDYLWYWGNSGFRLHEVGKKMPNHWGIYDILGNASEWTKDWFTHIKTDVEKKFFKNPIGPETGINKVVKGGGWYSSQKEVTVPTRMSKNPKRKDRTIGFRVVINLK